MLFDFNIFCSKVSLDFWNQHKFSICYTHMGHFKKTRKAPLSNFSTQERKKDRNATNKEKYIF